MKARAISTTTVAPPLPGPARRSLATVRAMQQLPGRRDRFPRGLLAQPRLQALCGGQQVRCRQLRTEVRGSAHHELVYFGLFVLWGKLLATFRSWSNTTHPSFSPAVLTGRTSGSRVSSFGGYDASHDRTFEPRYPKNVWGFMILFNFLLVITPPVIASSSFLPFNSPHHLTFCDNKKAVFPFFLYSCSFQQSTNFSSAQSNKRDNEKKTVRKTK